METIREITEELHKMKGDRCTVATLAFTPDEKGSGFEFDYKGDPLTLLSLLEIAKTQIADLVINGPKQRILRPGE